ncbi:glycosyltransferase family 4 protein [Desulfatitalea alkaliphila]|uniref:Glycosyltransferase family 4 protein n=1 Tax=Desulfatitalea alkaliphila TaxID=2929485 RepID=A0AA41R3R0_9BACT|nr:glycosyltransferase family 4 protein [Desulfatitalea alkaliphila]
MLSVDPIKFPLTGIGRYTYELAKGLALSGEVASLRFLRGGRLSDTLTEPSENSSAEHRAGLRRMLAKSRAIVSLYRRVAPRLKARVLRGMEDYVFHGPNYYLPPFKGTSVVTIHDLSPCLWPECHPAERIRFMLPEIELSLQRAKVLITDSEYTRREVADYFNWPLEKIHAVPLAAEAAFHPRRPVETNRRLKKYGLTAGGYCLFAGTIEPRKNIDLLLDAYMMLPVDIRRRWPLILTGYQGWNSDALHARLTATAQAGWARYLGFVPAHDLPFLFAGARLFVFPSLYEGFGLPVLEAMASGVPVVCSNAASLPEVVGDAAAMCDAKDVERLSRLIGVGLKDEGWRTRAVEKGLARAGHFSWQRCTNETIAAYQAALNA